MIEGRLRATTSQLIFYPAIANSAAVKVVLGGRWKGQAWYLPKTYANLRKLKEMYPSIEYVGEGFDNLESDYGFQVRSQTPPADLVNSWLKLYSFQKEAIGYLASSPHPGSMLALSPGLGKTAVSLITSQMIGIQSVLVVAPLPLLNTWVRESKLWLNKEIEICWGVMPKTKFAVMNYNTLTKFQDEIAQQRWDLIIFDESVVLKNRETARTKSAIEVRKTTKLIWELSGSPITKNVTDLWSQFHILRPDVYTSFWRFADQYSLLEHNAWGGGYGQSIVGTKPGIDYKSEFRDIMIRVSQEDVLDLPEYLYQTIELGLNPAQAKAYKELLGSFVTTLESGQRVDVVNIMAQLIRLQEICSNLINIGGRDSSSKHDTILELLETWDKPILIWSWFVKGAEALYQRLLAKGEKVAICTGQHTSEKTADETIEAYKTGKYDILILSLGVGKYGVTVTNTKTVIYTEKTWDADAFTQSLSRVRRIGLGHRPVLVTLRCPGTVDELVENNLAGKAIDIAKIGPPDLATMLRALGRDL